MAMGGRRTCSPLPAEKISKMGARTHMGRFRGSDRRLEKLETGSRGVYGLV